MLFKRTFCSMLLLAVVLACAYGVNYTPERVCASVSLKTPGNSAERYALSFRDSENPLYKYQLISPEKMPLLIYQDVDQAEKSCRVTVFIVALENVYFHFDEQVKTGYRHDDCLFYMPGFWYRRNLRSPKQAPSFHTSDSWVVREDRLSTPLTAVFNEKEKTVMSVIRLDDYESDALTTHQEGEVMLSGSTSIGYTGFENISGETSLSFGFPYKEEPRSYVRKLTLAPSVEAFQLLKKGETLTLTWELKEADATDFSECVQRTWEYCYDTYRPQPVETPYSSEEMKSVLSNYFVESFVDDTPVNYFSGVELRTATCERNDVAEVGFVGRTLLNAFNALEYGEQQQRTDLEETPVLFLILI